MVFQQCHPHCICSRQTSNRELKNIFLINLINSLNELWKHEWNFCWSNNNDKTKGTHAISQNTKFPLCHLSNLCYFPLPGLWHKQSYRNLIGWFINVRWNWLQKRSTYTTEELTHNHATLYSDTNIVDKILLRGFKSHLYLEVGPSAPANLLNNSEGIQRKVVAVAVSFFEGIV